MSLQSRVVEEWKSALKNKDPKKDPLSMIVTELKNRAIKDNVASDEGRVVSDEVALEVLQRMAKQRREAIDAYVSAKREDLADKERAELSVVESYLPEPLSDDELRAIIREVMEKINAKSAKDFGKVMGASIKRVDGRADGKRIQKVVQSLLHKE